MTDITPEAQAIIDTIIEKQEGGWLLTENKNDPDGGWTYAGVTASVFNKKFNSTYTYSAMHDNFTSNENIYMINKDIYDIYFEQYYLPLHLSELPTSIRGPLFSCAVNCGTETAVSILQAAYNKGMEQQDHIKVDGNLGPITIRSMQYVASRGDLKDYFLREWMLHYINLVQENAAAAFEAFEYVKLIQNNTTASYNVSVAMKAKSDFPKVNRAASFEGWFNRIDFWR